jgi:hypothetical protein
MALGINTDAYQPIDALPHHARRPRSARRNPAPVHFVTKGG